jgi:hypothetical protein
MPYLRFATGDRLRLDGEEMPGVVVAVEVEGENSIESIPRENRAGDVHVMRGYRDFRVRIALRLAGQDPLAEARKLQAKFAKSKTEPLRVVHPHLAARGVEKALFARLITRELGGEEGMEAVLELTQVEPREAIAQANAARRGSPRSPRPSCGASSPGIGRAPPRREVAGEALPPA